MAKRAVGGARGRAGSSGSRGVTIVLVLVGFVVLAVGVNLRRVYGIGQSQQIRTMQQRREALDSEQQKLQDAIRLASDRKHIIDIAQSRLNMRLPDLSQVIDLPRQPLARRDSVQP